MSAFGLMIMACRGREAPARTSDTLPASAAVVPVQRVVFGTWLRGAGDSTWGFRLAPAGRIRLINRCGAVAQQWSAEGDTLVITMRAGEHTTAETARYRASRPDSATLRLDGAGPLAGAWTRGVEPRTACVVP